MLHCWLSTALLLVLHQSGAFHLSQHQTTVVLAFDGFRFDYINKGITSHMSRIREQGVRVPGMKPQFPTNTYTNFASINTGLYPDYHGVTENVMYDPEKKVWLYHDGEEFWTQNEDATPIWVVNEMHGGGRYSGTIRWPGASVGYGRNHTLFPTYRITDDSSLWTNVISTAMSWIMHPEKPANLVLIYDPDPDLTSHYYGPESAKTAEKIRASDFKVAVLIKELEKRNILEKVNVIILSDHGIESVQPRNAVSLYNVGVNGELFHIQGQGQASTQIQAKRPRDSARMYKRLQSYCKHRNCTIYKKSELLKKFQGFGRNSRILDYLILPNPGYVVCNYFTFYVWTTGYHGYDPEVCENMNTVFLALGPSFKSRYDYDKIVNNLDMFPLLCTILGIPHNNRNGSLSRIVEILK